MFMSQPSAPGGRRLALVTGASSGIGLYIARLFAQNNYDLVIAAADPAIDEVATELRLLGADVETAQVDLTTREGVERLAGRFGTDCRPPDAIALNGAWGHVVALSRRAKAQAWAQLLAEDRGPELLQHTLHEEKNPDGLHTQLAESAVNVDTESA